MIHVACGFLFLTIKKLDKKNFHLDGKDKLVWAAWTLKMELFMVEIGKAQKN